REAQRAGGQQGGARTGPERTQVREDRKRSTDAAGGPDRRPCVLEAVDHAGHSRIVRIAVSPDGRLLASGDGRGNIRLWDAISGADRATTSGHLDMVYGLAFSPDGKILGSASADRTVRLWDTTTLRELAVYPAAGDQVRALAFSPDAELFVEGGLDQYVRLWRVKTGLSQAERAGHQGGITVAFSPDGSKLASAGADKTLRIWNTAAGSEEKSMTGHSGVINGIAWSLDGAHLATASSDSTVRIWDARAGREHRLLLGHKAPVLAVAFSPNGRLLASAGTDGLLGIWDTGSGGQVRSLSVGLRQTPLRLVFSADSSRLAVLSDGSIEIFDAAGNAAAKHLGIAAGESSLVNGSQAGILLAAHGTVVEQIDPRSGARKVVASHPRDMGVMALSANGSVGVRSNEGSASVLDTASGKEARLRGYRGALCGASISPDGNLVAVGSLDGAVSTWLAKSGLPFWRTIALAESRGEVLLLTHRGWESVGPAGGMRTSASSASASANSRWQRWAEDNAILARQSGDGALACLVSADNRLALWDLHDDRLVVEKKIDDSDAVVAFPNGCLVLAAGRAQLVDRSRGHTMLESASVRAVAGPDEDNALIALDDRVLVVDLSSGREKAAVRADRGITAMTRTKEYLVLGYREGQIQLAPFAPGSVARAFAFEGTPASSVAALVEGPPGILVAGFANGLVGLWSLENGRLLLSGRLHGRVEHLLVRRGSLFAASSSGQSLVWDLGAFYDHYCDILGEIWRDVTVVWEGGLPIRRGPSLGHPCQDRE
ncbi:MAG: WD40 repeat domain-containing protein, partial [Pseudomonadota bacterium]